jgi:hypothetical protein
MRKSSPFRFWEISAGSAKNLTANCWGAVSIQQCKDSLSVIARRVKIKCHMPLPRGSWFSGWLFITRRLIVL